ncbi:MAG: amino acid ABC transporter substrate-binding protein [Methylocystaceae bacterium]
MLKLKKGLALVLILALAMSVMAAGCGSKQEKAVSTWDQVQQDKKIVFGLDDAFRPMGFRDEKNNLVGFDIDMAKEMGKRLGIEFVPQPTPWDGVTAALNAKKFDLIISGMTITDERKKQIAFTDPYIKTGQVILVLTDNTTITGEKDLKDKIVGTQKGSSAQPLVEQLPDVKDRKFYSQFPEAVMDLKNKRVDCLVIDAPLVADLQKQMPGAFKPVGILAEEYYGIGLRQEDTELAAELNKVIKEMQKDGTLKALSQKWFGMDVTTF